jgi:predicted nuclease of predicted toxin-antitoxin system
LRLLLDEMYPSSVARELRARGHDVVSVHDEPGRGTPDDDVLDYACEEGRAVVTENVRDYRPLADARIAAGGSHRGLVLTTEKRWPRSNVGALIAAFDQLMATTRERPVDQELWL